MSGVMLGSAAIGAFSSYADSQNWWSGDKEAEGGGQGGGTQYMGPNIPGFSADPNVGETQDFLSPYGMNMMKGDVPDYYKGIGESGGQAFEDILGLTQRDMTRGVNEDLARRKVRGARGTDIVAKAMGDVTKKLRWDDYSRSLKGKEFLFGQGRGITEGVRAAGLTNQGQENTYALQKASIEERARAEQMRLQASENRNKESMWGQILSGGIGALGTVIGSYGGGTTTPKGGSATGNIYSSSDLSSAKQSMFDTSTMFN